MKTNRIVPDIISVTLGLLLLAGLYLTSLYSYVLFHTLAEVFSIAVAVSIFMLAWNARQVMTNNYLLIIGISYLFVAGIDLLHTLAYKGMGVFTGFDANLPTQLWIMGRYLESLSFLIAPFFLRRKMHTGLIFLAYTLVTAILLASVLYVPFFPDCFIEGKGLTPFKKISEYIISLIFITTIFLLVIYKEHFDRKVLYLIVWSLIMKVISELAFTFYISVYGFSNLVGHFFKILSFYLIYKAIIETGFAKPFKLLFRELKSSEESLREERDKLQDALATVKTLSGLLPICASCKKIRNDKGYWEQIEIYIKDRSDADFSHSICPECAKRLYPEFNKKDP